MWKPHYSLEMFQKVGEKCSSGLKMLCSVSKSLREERKQWRVEIRECVSSEPFSTGHWCLFALRQGCACVCVLGFSGLHMDIQPVNHGDNIHTHISILVNSRVVVVEKPRKPQPVIDVVSTELCV